MSAGAGVQVAGGRPGTLALVADDLTGAADSAAGLAAHGWRVVLHLGPEIDRATVHDDDLDRADDPAGTAPTVLAVTTRSRALPDADAARATAAAVDALVAAGSERLYLKIDSTVRGSVAAQVDGAVRAWSRVHASASAVVCPAFPELGRTVQAGVVRVDGVPVAETAAGRDPVTPVTASELATVVPGSTLGSVGSIGSPGTLLLDAADDADLDDIAAHLAGTGPEVVIVGSGGLSAALGRRWSSAPRDVHVATGRRTLLAVSSLHPVTATQLAHLRSAPEADSVDVLTTSLERGLNPARAAELLARRVAAALADHPYGALLLVGGDGAAAVLDHLGADRVVIDGTVLGGCPTGVVRAGLADRVRVVTKSGGFGGASSLSDIVHQLSGTPGTTTPTTTSVPQPAPTSTKEAS